MSARPLPSASSPARCVAWYFKDANNVTHGPSVIEALATLWRCGELTESTLVRPEHAARFVRIAEAPALLQLLQQPPAAHAQEAYAMPLSALLSYAEEADPARPQQAPRPEVSAQGGNVWCGCTPVCALYRVLENAFHG